MSEVKVNKLSPRSGTTVTIGDSGDTINIVGTLQNNGSALTGDISSVVAGTGLSGGGTSGDVTLNVEAAQSGITSLGTLTALNVAGNTTLTTTDNSDNLTLVSTDADGTTGPVLNLYRNSGSPADGDNVGFIRATGKNDANQDVDYTNIYNSIIDASDGSEDGAYEIYNMVGGTVRSKMKMDATETVFNNDSVDLDFRVESDGNANMLIVDAGTNRVGIGKSNPQNKIDINAETWDDGLTIKNTGNFSVGIIGDANRSGAGGGLLNLQGRWNGTEVTSIIFQAGSDTTNKDDGEIVFRTAPSGTPEERVKIHTNGVMSAANGIALGVGTANTASNVLDDYEEGTWTPTLTPSTSGSFTINNSENELGYKKIGSTVYVQGRITFTGNSSPSGTNINVGNLPFTPASPSEGSGWFGGMCAISNDGSNTFASFPITAYSSSTTKITTNLVSSLGNNARLHFNFFYYTNA